MAAEPRTWISKDFHIHESYSSDAPLATPEKYCRVAERRGFDEICFTTHLILAGPDVQHGISPDKIPSYLRDIEADLDAMVAERRRRIYGEAPK